MATARAIFQAHVDGIQAESIPYDIQWSLSSAIGQLDFTVLSIGNNTIAPPTGTTLILIQPPANSTAVLLLKKIAGDTGYPLSPTAGAVLSWTGVPSNTFVINSTALVTVQITYL